MSIQNIPGRSSPVTAFLVENLGLDETNQAFEPMRVHFKLFEKQVRETCKAEAQDHIDSAIESKAKEFRALTEELEQHCEGTVQNLEDQIKLLDIQRKEAIQTITSLQAKIAVLTHTMEASRVSSSSEISSLSQQHKQEMESLKEDLSSSSATIKDLETQIESLTQERDRLSGTIANTQGQLEQASRGSKEELARIQAELAALQNQSKSDRESLKVTIRDLKDLESSAAENTASLEKQLHAAQKAQETLHAQLEDAKQTLSKAKTTKAMTGIAAVASTVVAVAAIAFRGYIGF